MNLFLTCGIFAAGFVSGVVAVLIYEIARAMGSDET